MGHQAGSHGNGEAEGSHSGGHSPRGSTQSQSPPPMQQQPPHHFGMPPTHLYGFHPGHYTFPYPSPSFSQAVRLPGNSSPFFHSPTASHTVTPLQYQYPQRMGPPFKNVPHYPISPPGSSSLGAAGRRTSLSIPEDPCDANDSATKQQGIQMMNMPRLTACRQPSASSLSMKQLAIKAHPWA